jgi:hypothetical protein
VLRHCTILFSSKILITLLLLPAIIPCIVLTSCAIAASSILMVLVCSFTLHFGQEVAGNFFSPFINLKL